jgi:formylglycine-generating enzyme required for sulfatase activity
MIGNAWQWIADCYHDSYNGAPADGSAWIAGDCDRGRVVRGGPWMNSPRNLRTANRDGGFSVFNNNGFRVARTLAP